MKVYEATYDSLNMMPFSESYQEWIKDSIKKNVSAHIEVKFTEKYFSVDATDSTPLQLCSTLVFIGYAFGMQANGR